MSATDAHEPSPAVRTIDLEGAKMSKAMKERFSDLLRKSVGLPERGSSCCNVTAVGSAVSESHEDSAPSGGTAQCADARDAASRCGCGTDASGEV